MNTCAECRFWKDIYHEHLAFAVLARTHSGAFKECRRVREDYNGAFIFARGSDNDALMTRSDFGCVQFEGKPVDLKGIPVLASTTPYLPWRGVAAVETPEHGDLVLRLACGHVTTWPRTQSAPSATKCVTCDPPTFRGKPFPETMPVIYAGERRIRRAYPWPPLRPDLLEAADRIGAAAGHRRP